MPPRRRAAPASRDAAPVRPAAAPPLRRDSYLWLSTRPLHILIFLLPLVALYELGSALYLTDPDSGAGETIRAHRLLSAFFEAMGVSGLYLPGAALVVVLLLWHIFSRDRWRLRPLVLLGMVIESAAWALPLLVLGPLIQDALSPSPGATNALAATGGGVRPIAQMPAPARATIAIGAGLYEELLFRMVGIAAAHMVFVDLAKLKERQGAIAAVVVAAFAFAVYHDVVGANNQIDYAAFAFYLAAGLYFGGLYVARGFGIVVAAHVMYDLVALLT